MFIVATADSNNIMGAMRGAHGSGAMDWGSCVRGDRGSVESCSRSTIRSSWCGNRRSGRSVPSGHLSCLAKLRSGSVLLLLVWCRWLLAVWVVCLLRRGLLIWLAILLLRRSIRGLLLPIGVHLRRCGGCGGSSTATATATCTGHLDSERLITELDAVEPH